MFAQADFVELDLVVAWQRLDAMAFFARGHILFLNESRKKAQESRIAATTTSKSAASMVEQIVEKSPPHLIWSLDNAVRSQALGALTE